MTIYEIWNLATFATIPKDSWIVIIPFRRIGDGVEILISSYFTMRVFVADVDRWVVRVSVQSEPVQQSHHQVPGETAHQDSPEGW